MGLFNTKVLGLRQVSAFISGLVHRTQQSLAVDKIEDQILELTRSRLLPPGEAENAQIGSDGEPWAPPSPVTIERRKSNRNAAQAMFDTGELYDDIVILESRAATWFRKGEVTVGLKPSSRAREYIDLLEQGGTNPQGRPIPPRPIFGATDEQVNSMGQNMFEKLFNFLR